MERRTAMLTRRELEPRIVELARHRSGKRPSSPAPSKRYEALLQREMAPCDPEPFA